MPFFDPKKVIQTQSVRLNANISTTSGTLVDMAGLSLTFNKRSATSHIYFMATFSVSNTSALGANTTIALDQDGSTRDGATQTTPGLSNSSQTGSISYVFNGQNGTSLLSAGSHTLKLRWSNTAGTTNCRPTTVTGEHCSIQAWEVAP